MDAILLIELLHFYFMVLFLFKLSLLTPPPTVPIQIKFDLDFSDLLVKGRNVKGNIVTKYPVKKIVLKEKGLSTLKPRKIWFDDTVRRLNMEERGQLLGAFSSSDRLLLVTSDGILKTVLPEMTLHFPDNLWIIEKWEPQKPLSVVYWDGNKEMYYAKRFIVENPEREEQIISEHPKSFLELVSTQYRPQIEIVFAKERGKERKPNKIIDFETFIAVKGVGALGNQLIKEKVLEINEIEPLPYTPPERKPINEIEVNDPSEAINTPEEGEEDGKNASSPEQPTLF